MSDRAPPDALNTIIANLQIDREHKELKWLVSEGIMSEFDRIVETLKMCGNMLLYNSPEHPDPAQRIERGPPIKLPMTLLKLEAVKGIIVRDGVYVTQLNVNLKEAHFNRHIYRINLDQPFLLQQVITAKEAIDAAILLISNFNADQNHLDIVKLFENILKEILAARLALQLQTDPLLIFPLHKVQTSLFRPELPHNLALDLYINQSEVCLDLKNLHHVTEEPWCLVDSVSGKLYVDQVRDEMRQGVLILQASEHEPDVNAHTGTPASAFAALGNFLRPKIEPLEYIAKCVTYDGAVVMVNRKLEVLTADPLLVSTCSKLNSLESIVESFLHNLRVVSSHND